jgi:putative hydrolase of the HAD superfamily
VPKERQAFWSSAQERLGFDPQQTLFIDDSTPVLDAARNYGIRGLLAVNRPDSQRPARTVDGHASVETIGHLA